MILSNPDKPWDYLNISRNPNITWEIIDQNKFKPWYYNYISGNPMTFRYKKYLEKRLEEYRNTVKSILSKHPVLNDDVIAVIVNNIII